MRRYLMPMCSLLVLFKSFLTILIAASVSTLAIGSKFFSNFLAKNHAPYPYTFWTCQTKRHIIDLSNGAVATDYFLDSKLIAGSARNNTFLLVDL